MAQPIALQSSAAKSGKRRSGPLKRLWRAVREPFARSRLAKHAAGAALAQALRVVHGTNRVVEGSTDMKVAGEAVSPAIVALWHGQHFLAPFFYPLERPVTALVSRSADAELNAMVLEKLGVEPVRGSGGRDRPHQVEKGGARALLALKRALADGKNVVMIADVRGRPREAGLGAVTLARISGRPVVPMAVATSRRKVLERTWDKATVNLPFGRSAVVLGEPIFVPATAGAVEMEEKRQALTLGLVAANDKAYALVDRPA